MATRGKAKKIDSRSAQLYLPYSEIRGVQVGTLRQEEKSIAVSNGERDAGENKGVFSFFLGASALCGKLYYCRVPNDVDPNVLARLSSLRAEDKEAVKKVLADANAEIWILSRVVGSRVPGTWSGPYSHTDDAFIAYIEGEDKGCRVILVEDMLPLTISLSGLKK